MRQKCFSLLLGARNTSSAGQHFSPEDDERIRSITFRHFPNGFTILNADGGWFDPSTKRFIEEDSRQILICASGIRSLHRWLADLATALRQKELLVVELGSATTYKARGTAGSKRRVRSTSR